VTSQSDRLDDPEVEQPAHSYTPDADSGPDPSVIVLDSSDVLDRSDQVADRPDDAADRDEDQPDASEHDEPIAARLGDDDDDDESDDTDEVRVVTAEVTGYQPAATAAEDDGAAGDGNAAEDNLAAEDDDGAAAAYSAQPAATDSGSDPDTSWPESRAAAAAVTGADAPVAGGVATDPAAGGSPATSPATGVDASADWHDIQALFVDDPRGSVQQAAAAAEAAVTALATTLHERQAALAPGASQDTEQLREALRGYRVFCQDLASLGQQLQQQVPQDVAS
jgi:hypothetical protein